MLLVLVGVLILTIAFLFFWNQLDEDLIERSQTNNDLDTEYFEINGKDSRTENENLRLNEITKERKDNAEVVSRLLKQNESN